MLINTLQSTKDAAKFYTTKVEELGSNLKDLESIVQGKSNNLRVVEDGKQSRNMELELRLTHLSLVLRQKVLAGNAGAPAAE